MQKLFDQQEIPIDLMRSTIQSTKSSGKVKLTLKNLFDQQEILVEFTKIIVGSTRKSGRFNEKVLLD